MAYKHDYDKILTRLTEILSKLNNGEALSVKSWQKSLTLAIEQSSEILMSV